MDFTGKLINISQGWKTGKFNITFSVNESYAIREANEIIDCEKLSINAVKHREKRSLDSNAYCWVLIQKIAEAVHSDKWSVYLDLLKKYSRSFTHIVVKPEAVEAVKGMFRTCVDLGEISVNGQEGHQLQVYFGSSTFDSKEMSVFIDGIVSECKELDIETLPPDDIERMKALWKV